MKARAVVVSTHLDDAVLSCWSVLDGSGDVLVVTVFTGGPPPGVLTEWDGDSGAADSAERMRQRREEDRAALAIAGREPVHLGLLERQYGRGEVPAEALAPYLGEAAVVYAPAGIGEQHGNAEHVRVRDVILSIRPDARLYADQPYCQFKSDSELPPELGVRVARLVELPPAQRERKAQAIRCHAGELPKLEAHFGPFARPDRLAYELFWLLRS